MNRWLVGVKEFFHKRMVWMIIKVILALIVLAAVFTAGVFLGMEIYRSNHTLEVVEYTVTDEQITNDVRLVVLADLHNQEFGKENAELLSVVAAQEPDAILCVGDFVIDNVEDTEIPRKCLEDLVKIAPVYFSMGNHEVHHQLQFPVSFAEIFESCGVNVLEYEYEDLVINGQKLRLGGIYGYCVPEEDSENMRYDPKHTKFLKEFMVTHNYKLLMTHIPYTWLELNGLKEWDIDLVFCGHTHGGLIRLDGIGGVYAPVHGLFPGELEGKYESEDGERAMILTRGLGRSTTIPRINNVPEIMVVNLLGNK